MAQSLRLQDETCFFFDMDACYEVTYFGWLSSLF